MNARTIAGLAATLLAGTAFLAAPAANAVTVVAADQSATSQTTAGQTGTVIAQDQTSMIQAVPTAPSTVTVTAAPGAAVSLSAKGTAAQTKKADKQGRATFTKLIAGRTYTVAANGKTTTVTPVVNVGKASNLTVMATDLVDTVDLTWAHKNTRARGTLGYTVTATPANVTGAPITVEARSTSAQLAGLDPNALYSFSVAAHNDLGYGQPTVARMTRSLADITGRSTTRPIAQDDDASATPAPAPVPQPAPAPQPGPAPQPSTRTIWVCPDGFADVNGVCTQSRAYTYSTQTATSPYTYSPQFVETGRIWHDDPFNPFNGCAYTVHGDRCMGWEIQGYTTQVKNPTPAEWTDNGSAYTRQVQVKDATPAGWSDNGTEWIRTTAKVERVVPA